MIENKGLLARLLLVVLALIWGSSFILVKKGLVALGPMEVGALRIVAASLCLFPFGVRYFKYIEKREWVYLISVGFCGSLIPSFLFAFAQTRLPSGVTGILNTLVPIFTILIAALIFKHKQPGRAYLGVVVGFVGSVVLVMAGGGGLAGINYYAFLVFLATVFYATNVNLIKEYLQGQKALAITSVSLLLVGPIPIYFLLAHTDFIEKLGTVPGAATSALYVTLLGVMGTAVALIIFNHIVRLTNPVFTSSVTYIIPIVAVGWGLIDGETLNLMHLGGMALILAGVYVTNKRSKGPVQNKVKVEQQELAK
ncbi:MAG: DMT family transporter [Bacteroidota bacterium]